MLLKLIRHEFKSTARVFLPLFAAAIVLAGVNALLLPIADNMGNSTASTVFDMGVSLIVGLLAVLFFVLVSALPIVVLVVVVIRFYRALGDEGYLWFSLPATASQHLLARTLSALTWCVAAIVVVAASLLLCFSSYGAFGVVSGFLAAAASYGFPIVPVAVMLLILIASATLMSILTFYASIAVAPHISQSRFGGSLVAYLIAQVASSAALTAFLSVASVPGQVMFGSTFYDLQYNYPAFSDYVDKVDSLGIGYEAWLDALLRTDYASSAISLISNISLVLLCAAAVGCLLISVVWYLVSRHFLGRQLNLS
ncbi:MAG: hypothetical protein LBD25_06725 [Coriobacteriales bacterium]|jgi:hypothetical protein|nr:hypothetical protein [Coriobacteriales bacterium]